MAFNYQTAFEDSLTAVDDEGRYRVFADLERMRGMNQEIIQT